MPTSRVIAITTLALSVATPTGAVARQLLRDTGLDVRVDRGVQCGSPIDLTVEAEDPGLFEADSDRLQRVVDAARAMLAFECPDMQALNVQGYLRGLSDPVYRASAREADDWRLQVRSSIQAGAGAAGTREQPQRPNLIGGAGNAGGYSVAGLALGMSVDEAMSAVRRNFAEAPRYDAREGVLTMQAQGCPEDFDWARMPKVPRAGGKCLQAWFTDERAAELYRLKLIQVTATENTDQLEATLVSRYGRPAIRVTGWDPDAPDELSRNGLLLGWGETVAAAAGTRRASGEVAPRRLEAVIEPVRDVAVTTITLYDPSLRVRPDYRSPRAPDLRL
jgi:hypothetical protein